MIKYADCIHANAQHDWLSRRLHLLKGHVLQLLLALFLDYKPPTLDAQSSLMAYGRSELRFIRHQPAEAAQPRIRG